MRITLLAIGNKMPDWIETGFNEYAKRLTGRWSLQLIEIPAIKRTKQSDLAKIKIQESELLLKAVNPHDLLIALDPQGETFTTENLAAQLSQFENESYHVSLLIGGPEGLSPACLQHAKKRWSLSRLTFPHPLVRIIIAEQIYRAWSIATSHPYHR